MTKSTDVGRLVVAADVRLDNRGELITQLRVPGKSEEITDSALILHAYDRWGNDCVHHLLGDFAFAIWDRDKQRLVCARDHMGIRPFVYFHAPGFFAFASSLPALFSYPGVPRDIDPFGMAKLLNREFGDAEVTPYREIYRLPAAHRLVVERSRLQVERYWALDPEREIRLGSDAEYVEAFRELFLEAVACRMRGDGPVGGMLSGGLDSSSIVVAMRHLRPEEPVHTFSAVFGNHPEMDERAYIHDVVNQGGIISHEVDISQLALRESITVDLASAGVPQPYSVLTFVRNPVYRAVASRTHAVLDGTGGDQVLGVPSSYLGDLVREARFNTLVRDVKEAGLSPYRTGRRILEATLLGLSPAPVARRWLWHRRQSLATSTAPAASRFDRSHCISERSARLAKELQRPVRSREEQVLRLTSPLARPVVEGAVAAGWRAGLDVRFPFLDKRLVEFGVSLPPDQKHLGATARPLLRRAFLAQLPRIQSRTKGTFIPLVESALHREALGLRRELEVNREHLDPYIDFASVQATLDELLAAFRLNDFVILMKVVGLGMWLRQAKN